MNAAYLYAWEPDAYKEYDLSIVVKDNLYDKSIVKQYITNAALTKSYATLQGGFLNALDIQQLIDGQDTSQQIMQQVEAQVASLNNPELEALAELYNNFKKLQVDKNNQQSMKTLMSELVHLLTECEKITGKAMNSPVNKVAAMIKTDTDMVSGYMGNFVTTGKELSQSQKQVESAMKAVYTSANKIISWTKGREKYLSASTGMLREKKIDSESTFQTVISSLSRSIIFLMGFAEEVFVNAGDIKAQKEGFKYIGSLNKEIVAKISSKEGIQGTFLEDLTMNKDEQELNEIENEYNHILNYKMGNPKADFMMSATINGNYNANIGIQWKSSYFSTENSLPSTVNAGGFGMPWSLAFQKAELYGLKLNNKLDVSGVALQLYTAMPYNEQFLEKRRKKYYLNGGNEEEQTVVKSSLATDFIKARDATEKMMIIDGIIGSGKNIDSNLFYVIKGKVYSSLELAYQALIQPGGYTIQDNTKNSLQYDQNKAIEIQQKNWEEVPSKSKNKNIHSLKRSHQIASNYSNIFSKRMSGKIRINLNRLTFNKKML